MDKAREHRLHLLGVCSDGGVHAQLTHLYALLEMAKREGVAEGTVKSWLHRGRASLAAQLRPAPTAGKEVRRA